MMQVCLPQASLWKHLISTYAHIGQEIYMICSEDSFTLQTVDSGNVCILQTKLFAAGMKHFTMHNQEVVALSLAALKASMRTFRDDDELVIDTVTEDNKCILSTTTRARDIFFCHPQLVTAADSEWFALPDDHPYKAKVTVSSALLIDYVKNMSKLSRTCRININKESITFSIESDVVSSSTTLNGSQCILDVISEIHLHVSLDMWVKAVEMAHLTQQVTLCLCENYPLEMRSEIPLMGRVSLFLAPLEDQ